MWKAHVEGHIPLLTMIQTAPDFLLSGLVQRLRTECLEAFHGISRASRKGGKKVRAVLSCNENVALRDVLKYLIRNKCRKCFEKSSSDDVMGRICDFDADFFDVRHYDGLSIREVP